MGIEADARLERGKRALEFILDREWQLTELTFFEEFTAYLKEINRTSSVEPLMKHHYFLRKKMPEIIIAGTNQVVFSLSTGYIGKTRFLYPQFQSANYIAFVGMYPTPSALTYQSLKELGFEVPEHHYVDIERKDGEFKVKDKGLTFVIASDLTEGGKQVEDVKDEHFQRLDNGAHLKEQFEEATSKLLDIYQGKNFTYAIGINSHRTAINGHQEAIQRTFLLQIDPTTNIGRLVAGDLGNILLTKSDANKIKRWDHFKK